MVQNLARQKHNQADKPRNECAAQVCLDTSTRLQLQHIMDPNDSPIWSLPLELHEHVFRFLSASHRVQLSMVSVYFNKAIEDFQLHFGHGIL